jgi:hypothetical protein
MGDAKAGSATEESTASSASDDMGEPTKKAKSKKKTKSGD